MVHNVVERRPLVGKQVVCVKVLGDGRESLVGGVDTAIAGVLNDGAGTKGLVESSTPDVSSDGAVAVVEEFHDRLSQGVSRWEIRGEGLVVSECQRLFSSKSRGIELIQFARHKGQLRSDLVIDA